jgi:phenylalanyl-tRNA synthetase alpha chain
MLCYAGTIMEIRIPRDEEKRLLAEMEKRSDFEALRIRRYLALPDLTRVTGSPLSELVRRIRAIPDFKEYDVVEAPEIMGTDIVFDLFDFPADHPARSRSDSYFINNTHLLRTHTTVMWYYWLKEESVREKIAAGEAVGALSFGKVYRKDEIDRKHMNVFHQIDGWYLTPKEKKTITIDDLKKVLADIAVAAFGPSVKYRFNPDTFPYTDPSIEMEIDKDGNGTWVEVLGAGVVKGSVLDNLGVDSSKWNGWAFGFGLERLAIISMELPDIRLLWSEDERVKRQLKLGQVFKEVSKYPPVVRDISFIVNKDFVPNNYFDLVRDIAGDLVEQVERIDTYENEERLGAGKVSYAYRITYRSIDRTLTNEEVGALHTKLEKATVENFSAKIR